MCKHCPESEPEHETVDMNAKAYKEAKVENKSRVEIQKWQEELKSLLEFHRNNFAEISNARLVDIAERSRKASEEENVRHVAAMGILYERLTGKPSDIFNSLEVPAEIRNLIEKLRSSMGKV